jgi:restriction system protein
MMILLLFWVLVYFLIYRIIILIWSILFKIKINSLIESVNTAEDLLYFHFNDFFNVIIEVFKRKGYKVRITDKCGEEGNGLILNDIQYVEVWKHATNKLIDVETAMKLTTRMQFNLIYRGMLVTLGDYKQNTKLFCHKNVIDCINGEQLLVMCKEVQKRKEVLQTN